MDLLPKCREDFGQTDYWNTFFRKRGSKAFEWYGEYLELCDQIHKYIKPADKIVMLGCGNSKLSMDMYDAGFCHITNIDISPIAIKKMIDINSKTRPDMKHLQMDATAMTFDDENFSVALDKGTLDAIFVDDSEETKKIVSSYLKEVLRTLRNGGRYLCVSLLQEHIIQYILEFFSKNACMIRIVHCLHAGEQKNDATSKTFTMPVFVVVITKFKSLPVQILEYSSHNGKIERVSSVDKLFNAITSIQKAALVCNGIANNSLVGHGEVSIDLSKVGESTPRYTLHILDQAPASNLSKYAAFIVPQGREIEWLFSTPAGRRKVQSQANYQRLIIVTLHRDQIYSSLEAVKEELADSVKKFAPPGKDKKIPYLSLGSDVGQRETLLCGSSQISGDFRIEEVEGSNGQILRRLIFLSNPFVVQSEALVKTIKTKGKKERKKIDIGHLACEHHLYMSVGAQLIIQSKSNEQKDILVVGLGGGGLCSFLNQAMPHARLTAVEIDPIMLEISEKFFELKQNNRFHVVIDDGLSFLERCQNEDIHFNAVLFDVDSKDISLGISCPPQSFLTSSVLTCVKKIIGDNGIFILNLVCRDDSLRNNALSSLKEVFHSICCYKLDEDINEVIYCSNDHKYETIEKWKQSLDIAGRQFNSSVRDNKLSSEDLLDLESFLKTLEM